MRIINAMSKLIKTPFITLWLLILVLLSQCCSTITYSSSYSSTNDSKTSSLRHCKFPAIFNFGDSNSDTGGLSALGQHGPPYGMTYFHHPAGRYSDGRLIIDFIANKLGLEYLSAYLDSVGSNFSHGVNFAISASSIRAPNTTSYSPFSLDLDVQYTQLNDFHRKSQFFRNKGGIYETILPRAEYFSQALYTFDIGQNDLVGGYLLNTSIDRVKASVPDALAQFKTIIKYVYDQGGRSFWIHNVGPVGCLLYIMDVPIVRDAPSDKAGCKLPYNELAKFFNRGLKETVAQLRKQLHLAAITYVDIYSLKYSLFSQPKKHGFEEPLRACCGHGGKYNMDVGCGGKVKIKGKEVMIGKPCKNPSVRVSWDGAHYTEAANKFIFDKIADGSFSDPPIPLNMACHRNL